MTTELVDLEVEEASLVDQPANPLAKIMLFKRDTNVDKAEWTTAFVNDLPDSSFAIILPGGEKDENGKTTPRKLRKLPYKDASGEIDIPHLRNALARLPQADLTEEQRAKARRKLVAAARTAGVEVSEKRSETVVNDQEKTLLQKLRDWLNGDWVNEDPPTPAPVDKKEVNEVADPVQTKTPEETVSKADLDALREELEKRDEELQKRDERIQKLEDDAKISKFVDVAKSKYAAIAKADELGPVLKRAAETLSEEDFTYLEQLLKSAQEFAEQSRAFEALGKAGEPDADSPEGKLEQLAKAHQKEHSDLTYEQAYAVVLRENPELYNELRTNAR